jgi:hypothetical protein
MERGTPPPLDLGDCRVDMLIVVMVAVGFLAYMLISSDVAGVSVKIELL